MLLVRAPLLQAEKECRLPSMVMRLQSMGEEWKKTRELGKIKIKIKIPLERTIGAVLLWERGRRNRSCMYKRALLGPLRGQDQVAPGPSPNCSCSGAVIWTDVWGAVNISIYKTWNWKLLVYYFTQCFSSGNIPLKNLFSLVCHSVIIRYYFYEAFGHRIMQCLCKHFSAFFVNIWAEHVGIFSSLLLTFII